MSFSVSTALIKETISANESLSAVEASKIASTLSFSVTISADKAVSTASKEDTSPAMKDSKEFTDASTVSNPCLMSHTFAIFTLSDDTTFAHVIELRKSEICFERICAILFI